MLDVSVCVCVCAVLRPPFSPFFPPFLLLKNKNKKMCKWLLYRDQKQERRINEK